MLVVYFYYLFEGVHNEKEFNSSAFFLIKCFYDFNIAGEVLPKYFCFL